MKKGQIITGTIEKVAFPNKGMFTTEEGRTVIVKNTIPGQTVSVSIQKVRKGKAEGRLLEVVKKAENELTEAVCPHFGACGGCTFLNLSYEDQVALKESQVRELLDEVAGETCVFDEVFEGVKSSPRPFAYRNKMEFSFGDSCKDGPLSLGMHKRGSFYDIVTVDSCKIVDEDYNKILRGVLDFFQEKEASFYHRLRHEGYLRHLLVRKAVKTEEILIDLVTTTQELRKDGTPCDEAALLNAFTEMLKNLPLDGKIVGILHTKNDSVADVVANEGTDILYGQDYFYEELLGLKFKISPFSFFQTNSLGAEVLYETAREFIRDAFQNENGLDGLKNKVIYDLYSGTGTIAQMLAPVAEKVIGVEIVSEAVEAAKENARLNGLDNCEFIAGDVLKVLDGIEERPDFIVLDPPRDGIHPKALEKIISYGVDRMIYISCKPTSLARDLEVLQARGYAVKRLCCVDMFPFTGNIETVVLLSKGAKGSVDLCLAWTEAERRQATYEQIKAYVLEQTGLKVSSLYIAQIKKKCGLDVGENFNLTKSENTRQPQCTPEKEDAIMQAFRHFGII